MRALFLLLTLAALSPLRAEWRVQSSTPFPTNSPAVAHHLKIAADGHEPGHEPGRAVELHLVTFNRSRCALRVVDLAPGETVEEGVRGAGGLAGVNGGYFQPDRSPLGLVVSHGVKLHPQERSKILSGLLVVTPHGANLLRTAEFRPTPAVKEALQAGPFLVDRGQPVGGLNATRPAERTVLLADKKGVAALLVTQPVTLAELAQILATPRLFPELKIERALNLDGGSSTALWVDAAPAPFSRPEWKRVRNAVAVVPVR